MPMSTSSTLHPEAESSTEPDERDNRLRMAVGVVLARTLASYPEDPEQAAEMTVRVALDVLDELKPSRSRKVRTTHPNMTSTLGNPADSASLFRAIANRDWMPLDDRKRERFLRIVQQAAPSA
jgi:hypothetical protein